MHESEDVISPFGAVLAETVGTFFLVFVIFALSDKGSKVIKDATVFAPFFPLLIGLTVAMIISCIGALTQAALNPARDFGPRLFAWLTGWGKYAIPGPRNGFWVYFAGPLLGGILAGAAYTFLFSSGLRKQMPKQHDERSCKPVGSVDLENRVPIVALSEDEDACLLVNSRTE